MAKFKKMGAVGLSALIVASAPNIVGLQADGINSNNVAYAAELSDRLDFSDGTSIELEGTPSINYGESGDRVRTVDLNLKVNGYKSGDALFLLEGFDLVNKDGEDVSESVSIFQKAAEGAEIKLKNSNVVVGKVTGQAQEDGSVDYAIIFNENIENLDNAVISVSTRYDVGYPVRYAKNAEQNAGDLPIELYVIGGNGQDFEKLYETKIPQQTNEVYPLDGYTVSHGSKATAKNDKNGIDFDYVITAIADDVKEGDTVKMSVVIPEGMELKGRESDVAKIYNLDFLYLKSDFDKGNLNRGYLKRSYDGSVVSPNNVNYNEKTRELTLDYKADKDYDTYTLESPKINISTANFNDVFASRDGELRENSLINYNYTLSDSEGGLKEKVEGVTRFIQVPDAVLGAVGDYSETNEREEEVPFKTSYKGDGSLEFEKQEVKVEGQNGKNKLIDTLDANGEVVDTKTEVVSEPVNKVIHVGNEKDVVKEIPFKVIKRKNPELPAGTKEKKISDGANGSRTIRYRYDVNKDTGKLVGDGLKISDEVTKKPVDEIWEYNDDVVRKNNEDYTPNVIEKTIYVGDDIPADILVINKENLPKGTKITYKPGTEPDNNKVGDYNVVVVTTYPDGSSDETETVVHVIEKQKEQEDDDVVQTVNPRTKDVTVKVGTKVEPKELVTNVNELPEGTKFTYKPGTEPDINKVGKYNVTIVSSYPDGKVVETPAVVNVVDVEVTTTPIKDNEEKVKPTAQEKTVKVGTEVTAKELITNTDKLPENTKYSFKEGTAPDISKVGDYKVVVVTTYPDGTSDETPTVVHVVDDKENAASSQTQSGNPLSVQTGGAVAGGAGVAAIFAGVAASYFNDKKKNK